jgi:serine phosphatase RsbU (regulator of sigma subunit)
MVRAQLARAEAEAALADAHAARAEADAARAAHEFLALAGREMAVSMDYRTTLRAVADAAVPVLADFCAVTIRRADGLLETLAVAHADESLTGRALAAFQRFPARPDAEIGPGRVIRTGEPQLIAPFDEAMLADSRGCDSGQLEVLRELAPRAMLNVPLRTPSQTIGAITLVLCEPGRVFGDGDLQVVTSLAARAALHVQNARMYSERSHIAQTLQRSLLPPRLPAVPGLDVAAAYRAAGDQNEVGGDFYDLFETGDGAWTAIIGDVSGKGAEAAAVTSLARHTLFAATLRSGDPGEQLRLVNDALRARGPGMRFCTLAHVRIRPAAGHADATVTLAGHLPPLVLRRDGSLEELGATGTLLGVVPEPALAQVELRLEAGDLLLLYTDGVTELRDRDLGFGQRQLHDTLRGRPGRSAEAVVDAVVRRTVELQGGEPRDDIAALALKVPDGPAD